MPARGFCPINAITPPAVARVSLGHAYYRPRATFYRWCKNPAFREHFAATVLPQLFTGSALRLPSPRGRQDFTVSPVQNEDLSNQQLAAFFVQKHTSPHGKAPLH